ncbi:hypothetical protein [Candidatus Enterococcus ferrettii]|uniref:Uncharacterized protein n=1 Tax=Candidatus Enterococcus ferrettii TaxID=2815324 RepID=A0ABV0EI13_9ENTE|nr:hypothetical protein [Enterococcus sp. 665A]MBO1341883.1 hypothetical protein [Enterococcus sp. 665A]
MSQKEYINFYLNDWLLPYEISTRYYKDENCRRTLVVESLIPKNLDTIFNILLVQGTEVSLRTINGLKVVGFKPASIEVLEIISEVERPLTVKFQYKE